MIFSNLDSQTKIGSSTYNLHISYLMECTKTLQKTVGDLNFRQNLSFKLQF